MVFLQNLLEKAYFTPKMSGSAMVWPASSDFWKALLVSSFLGITVYWRNYIKYLKELRHEVFWNSNSSRNCYQIEWNVK